MTRIGQIFADLSAESNIIRADPPDPRHPRSILAISVLIRSIRVIRVLFLLTEQQRFGKIMLSSKPYKMSSATWQSGAED